MCIVYRVRRKFLHLLPQPYLVLAWWLHQQLAHICFPAHSMLLNRCIRENIEFSQSDKQFSQTKLNLDWSIFRLPPCSLPNRIGADIAVDSWLNIIWCPRHAVKLHRLSEVDTRSLFCSMWHDRITYRGTGSDSTDLWLAWSWRVRHADSWCAQRRWLKGFFATGWCVSSKSVCRVLQYWTSDNMTWRWWWWLEF